MKEGANIFQIIVKNINGEILDDKKLRNITIENDIYYNNIDMITERIDNPLLNNIVSE